MKKIDLLKVSDGQASSEAEARLEGKGGACSGGIFPKDFAAYGCNGSIQFADKRIAADE